MKKDKKNQEKGFFGQSLVYVVVFLFEIIFSLGIIINSISIVGYTIKGVIRLSSNDFDNYYQEFYKEENNEYSPVILGIENTNIDIKEADVNHIQIVLYSWGGLIATEIMLFGLMNVCELTRKTLKKLPNNIYEKENLEIIKKIKKYLIIGFVVPIVISIIVFIFIPLPVLYDLNILIEFFATFAFYDFVKILLEHGLEPKTSK